MLMTSLNIHNVKDVKFLNDMKELSTGSWSRTLEITSKDSKGHEMLTQISLFADEQKDLFINVETE
jgi:hypothetical protein